MENAARLLTDAVNAAIAVGIEINIAEGAELGVVCTSTAQPLWELDPMVGRVSVLGAVLMALQPPLADEDAALSHVFGSRPEFHEGIEDGASGVINCSHEDRLYSEGHTIGKEIRGLIQRRYGIPVERSSIETTEEIEA
jgi:hypothetical protein